MLKKTCSKCGFEKPQDQFRRRNLRKPALTSWCIECIRLLNKQTTAEWRLKNRIDLNKMEQLKKDKKASSLKYHYNMTLEEFNTLLINQNYRCAICNSITAGGKGGFHVDHDHHTNVTRGLLCHYCNLGLGHFKDDRYILSKAQDYLERHDPEMNTMDRQG